MGVFALNCKVSTIGCMISKLFTLSATVFLPSHYFMVSCDVLFDLTLSHADYGFKF